MKLVRGFLSIVVFAVIFPAAALSQTPAAPPSGKFQLQDGDVVVFYGDSITEQRLYTSYVEEYLLTRFPTWNVRFINSGVGGDKVSGGWAGPIDMRLTRDVIAYHPTLMTIMLGMNDGYYRPYDPGIASTFRDEYEHILARMDKESAGTRLTLIRPSPHDDVTRDPDFTPSYNESMIKFGEIVSELAAQHHALVADFNRPVVDVLVKARGIDPAMSITLIRDRVHPGDAVQWIMAESLLKTWNAPPLVSSATLDASQGKATDTTNTEITELRRNKSGLTWTQLDKALPLPLPPAAANPFMGLTLQSSDLLEALDQQLLRVSGLDSGDYELRIDDRKVATCSAGDLAKGVNLATVDTPMLAQSRLVAFDTSNKNEIESTRFQLWYGDPKTSVTKDAVDKLTAAWKEANDRQRKDAQPVPHRFALIRGGAPITK